MHQFFLFLLFALSFVRCMGNMDFTNVISLGMMEVDKGAEKDKKRGGKKDMKG